MGKDRKDPEGRKRHKHMWQEDGERHREPKFEGWGTHKERRKRVLGVWLTSTGGEGEGSAEARICLLLLCK